MNVKLFGQIIDEVSKRLNLNKEHLDVEDITDTIMFSYWDVKNRDKRHIEVEYFWDLETMKIKLDIRENRFYERKIYFKLNFNLNGLLKLLSYIEEMLDVEDYEIDIVSREKQLVRIITDDNTVINVMCAESPYGYLDDDEDTFVVITVEKEHEFYVEPPREMKEMMEIRKKVGV